jgi:hypothetical protein
LTTTMPELSLSLFILSKFIIEMWLYLSHHADMAVNPEELFLKYLYPGYVFLLGSILAMLISWLFSYPPFLYSFRTNKAARFSYVMMLLRSIFYFVLWEILVCFTNEPLKAIMGWLGIVIILTQFSLYYVLKAYRRIFLRWIPYNMEPMEITTEEENREYAMIMGGICSFVVGVSIILSWHEVSSLNTLKNFTFAIFACLLLSLILRWLCTKHLSDPATLKTSGSRVPEPPPRPQHYIHPNPEMIDSSSKPQRFQGGRPPVSLLRFNSIRRR